MAPNGLACAYLFFLLLAVLSQVSCGSKMGDHHSHPSSHIMMDHMDPRMTAFFFIEELKQGQNFSISLEDKIPNPLTSPFLLRTKEEGDAIPFSSKQLPAILQHFSFPKGSRKAQVLAKTIRECEASPIMGETKFCATSLESMVEFARRILGSKNGIQLLATKFENPAESSEIRVQEYTMARIPQRILAPKMVTCHGQPYPYVVMYCHTQEEGNRLYRVFLQAKNGEGVETFVVCHMDTSQWSPDHLSFRALGIQPGSAPVCHFLPTHSFSLVPSTTTASSSV